MTQAENELKSNSFKQWTQAIDVWHALLFLADPKAIVTDDAYNSYNTILGNAINVVCFVALGIFGPVWARWLLWNSSQDLLYLKKLSVFRELSTSQIVWSIVCWII